MGTGHSRLRASSSHVVEKTASISPAPPPSTGVDTNNGRAAASLPMPALLLGLPCAVPQACFSHLPSELVDHVAAHLLYKRDLLHMASVDRHTNHTLKPRLAAIALKGQARLVCDLPALRALLLKIEATLPASLCDKPLRALIDQFDLLPAQECATAMDALLAATQRLPSEPRATLLYALAWQLSEVPEEARLPAFLAIASHVECLPPQHRMLPLNELRRRILHLPKEHRQAAHACVLTACLAAPSHARGCLMVQLASIASHCALGRQQVSWQATLDASRDLPMKSRGAVLVTLTTQLPLMTRRSRTAAFQSLAEEIQALPETLQPEIIAALQTHLPQLPGAASMLAVAPLEALLR